MARTTASNLFTNLGLDTFVCKDLDQVVVEIDNISCVAIELLEIILFEVDPLRSKGMRCDFGSQLLCNG